MSRSQITPILPSPDARPFRSGSTVPDPDSDHRRPLLLYISCITRRQSPPTHSPAHLYPYNPHIYKEPRRVRPSLNDDASCQPPGSSTPLLLHELPAIIDIGAHSSQRPQHASATPRETSPPPRLWQLCPVLQQRLQQPGSPGPGNCAGEPRRRHGRDHQQHTGERHCLDMDQSAVTPGLVCHDAGRVRRLQLLPAPLPERQGGGRCQVPLLEQHQGRQHERRLDRSGPDRLNMNSHDVCFFLRSEASNAKSDYRQPYEATHLGRFLQDRQRARPSLQSITISVKVPNYKQYVLPYLIIFPSQTPHSCHHSPPIRGTT